MTEHFKKFGEMLNEVASEGGGTTVYDAIQQQN
jgi:hypothetical protein